MSDILGNELEVAHVDDDAGNRLSGGTARAALEYVAKSIVDEPEAVVVEAEETPSGTILRVHVATDDKGKIIGKRGRVAMSIRTLIRAIGARDGQTISVDIADD